MSGSVSLAQIVVVVVLGSLLSLGGGNGSLAVIQSQWVETGMLDPTLFAWTIALGHLTPGPKVGYLSGVGYYLQGLPGVVAALVGIIIPTCLGAAGATSLLDRLRPLINRISLPAGFVVAGMIAAAAWGTAAPMHLSIGELLAVVAVAALVGWRNVEPVALILGAAALGLLDWLL